MSEFRGDQTAAFNAMQNAVQQLASKQGITGVFEVGINVAGTIITVRGNVVNGIVNIGTAFITK